MTAAEVYHLGPKRVLAPATNVRRGYFKVYLGAAPGVGKTCAMLAAAHAEKGNGRDVVIGAVQTHGRPGTEALVAGLDLLPPASILHKNRRQLELDLDGALARRPSLLLVDEFAHTNVAGSRNRKRWQDIEELLQAGIDVWTTLNVKHLESLNNVAQRITNKKVRNTVPDRAFDGADEIVLVDLAPDTLLKRVADGKLYSQNNAAVTWEVSLTTQSLRALRQLSLRRAVERMETAFIAHAPAQKIEGPWASGERILAYVGPDTVSHRTVRTAKRLADLMGAPWIAVAQGQERHLDQTQRRNVSDTLQLARDLGADVRMLLGNNLPAEILQLSKSEKVTQIVIGRSRRELWTGLFQRSLPQELIRRIDDTVIHLVAGGDEPASWLPQLSRPWLPALARNIGGRRPNQASRQGPDV